jgi:hypothetical protein
VFFAWTVGTQRFSAFVVNFVKIGRTEGQKVLGDMVKSNDRYVKKSRNMKGRVIRENKCDAKGRNARKHLYTLTKNLRRYMNLQVL